MLQLLHKPAIQHRLKSLCDTLMQYAPIGWQQSDVQVVRNDWWLRIALQERQRLTGCNANFQSTLNTLRIRWF